jgi:hypothetical protein
MQPEIFCAQTSSSSGWRSLGMTFPASAMKRLAIAKPIGPADGRAICIKL